MKKTLRFLMALWMFVFVSIPVCASESKELNVNALKPTAFDSIQEGEEKGAVQTNSAAIETVKVENDILYISAKTDDMVAYHLGGSPSKAKWFPLLLSFTNKDGDGIAVNMDGTAGNTDQAPYFGGIEGRDTVQWFGVLSDGSNLNGKVLTYTDRTSGNVRKLTIQFHDASQPDVKPDQPKPDDPTPDEPQPDDPKPDQPQPDVPTPDDPDASEKIYELWADSIAFDGQNPMMFELNDDLENFIMVCIDGEKLDPKHYELEEGSIIIVLHASYLKTLSKGTHEIEVITKNVAIGGEFEVPNDPKKADFNPVAIKDTSGTNMWLIYSAGLLGVVGFGAVFVWSQHRKKDV